MISEQTRLKMSLSKIGVMRTEESKLKQSFSISGEKHHAAKTWILQAPTGARFTTKSMILFCETHGLNYSSLRNKARTHEKSPLIKGLSKGWSVLNCD